MAPEKITHHSDNPMQITPRSTAPETVFRLVEIRQLILNLLSPSDLASVIRVEKGCGPDVARTLYKKVDCVVAEALSSTDPHRQHLYTNAIIEIDARSMSISPEMLQTPGWQHRFEEGDLIREYDPLDFNFIVPYLRLKFPSLRKIHFGRAPSIHDGEETYEWTVTFPAASQAVYDKGGYTGELGGHIDMIQNHDFWLDQGEGPPERLDPPPLPKGNYTIQYRFNLTISQECEYVDSVPPELYHSWSLALTERPGFENLHTHANLGRVPLTFEILIGLYLKQASAGHTTRVQSIIVGRLLPYTLVEFTTFASIASTSLVSLEIAGGRFTKKLRSSLTFADMPAFMSVIRADLPCLSKLSMLLHSLGDAESDCKKLLTSESLRAGGTVKDFYVEVGLYDDPVIHTSLFNVIRMLSAIFAPEAKVQIVGSFKSCRSPFQTAFLGYLRRQSPERQFHLATLDFPMTLGITKLAQVLQLDYHPDGRPFRVFQKPPGVARGRTESWYHQVLLARSSGAADQEDGSVVALAD